MDFKQKFEPKRNKILHGAGQSLEMFTKYWGAVDKYKPLIYMTYVKIQSLDAWIGRIQNEVKKFPNLILQIGLNLRINGEDKTKEISKGIYDFEFSKLFKLIKELENPTLIRIGYEFDKKGRHDSKNYILAFRHIVNLYREVGIDNIASVWCSCPYPGTEPFEPYYPGDEYVDWFGIDVFGEKYFKDNSYEPTERFLNMALEHKKPVIVGESSAIKIGIENGEKIWKEWFKPYFKWIKSHKQIKAFCYINWDWGKDWKQPEWKNCRIHENEYVREKYVKEIKKTIYVHNQPIGNLSKLLYQ